MSIRVSRILCYTWLLGLDPAEREIMLQMLAETEKGPREVCKVG